MRFHFCYYKKKKKKEKRSCLLYYTCLWSAHVNPLCFSRCPCSWNTILFGKTFTFSVPVRRCAHVSITGTDRFWWASKKFLRPTILPDHFSGERRRDLLSRIKTSRGWGKIRGDNETKWFMGRAVKIEPRALQSYIFNLRPPLFPFHVLCEAGKNITRQ